MENENLRIRVSPWVSNIAKNTESTNTVKIYLDKVIEELIEDESGIVISDTYESHQLIPNCFIRLHPCSLTGRHLYSLLRDQQVPYCEYLGQEIANGIDHALANNDSLRIPVYVTVVVKVIEVRRFVLSPVVSVSRGASEEVFQRLVEEHRMKSTEDQDEACSICFENFSENIIIRMPQCLHMFHQDCLFEWLGRQNSCPLCRRVPYEDETQILA